MRIMIYNENIYNLEKVTSIHIIRVGDAHTIPERSLLLDAGAKNRYTLEISAWFDDMEEEDAREAEKWLITSIALYMAGAVQPCEPLNLVETLNLMEEDFNA